MAARCTRGLAPVPSPWLQAQNLPLRATGRANLAISSHDCQFGIQRQICSCWRRECGRAVQPLPQSQNAQPDLRPASSPASHAFSSTDSGHFHTPGPVQPRHCPRVGWALQEGMSRPTHQGLHSRVCVHGQIGLMSCLVVAISEFGVCVCARARPRFGFLHDTCVCAWVGTPRARGQHVPVPSAVCACGAVCSDRTLGAVAWSSNDVGDVSGSPTSFLYMHRSAVTPAHSTLYCKAHTCGASSLWRAPFQATPPRHWVSSVVRYACRAQSPHHRGRTASEPPGAWVNSV